MSRRARAERAWTLDSPLVTALHDLPLPIDGGLLGLMGGILGPPG